MNPETVLDEIAIAIKHRTVSDTNRWHIVYFYDRITCVPSYTNVPPEVILGKFTEDMVSKGFSTSDWNQLKTNIIKIHKKLH